jgi:hypothetical protein
MVSETHTTGTHTHSQLELVESRVEAGRQAESGAREVEEKLVAMAKAALFKGIPHLDQPQEVRRGLVCICMSPAWVHVFSAGRCCAGDW